MTPNKLSEFLLQYVGCKYTWWHEGQEVGSEAPFYSKQANIYPTVEEVRVKGINCAGLMNIGRSFCGLAGFGGTYQIEPLVNWKELKEDTPIHEGVVLFRTYTDDDDQGHIGYAISDTEFIHSCDYDEVETGVVVSPIKPWSKYMTHWTSFEEVFGKN